MKNLIPLSVYAIVGFVSAGVNFLLMPYLSHYIRPGEYGILSMINSYVTILIPLIGMVASGVVFVDYFKIKDKAEFASLFSSVQVIPLLPAAFFLIINLLFPSIIGDFLGIPENKTIWLTISVIIALLTIYSELFLNFLITEQRAGLFTFFNLLKLLIEVLLTLWFVAGRGMNWEGRLLSWLITNLFTFIFAYVYFRKRGLLVKNVSWKYIMAGVSFGLPLILHTLGKFVINQSDRIFIAQMVSIEEAGVYNVGYQVGMIMLILVSAIGNFIYPFISMRLADPTPQHKSEIVRMSYMVTSISFIFLLLITAATPTFFSTFVDKSYADATRYVFWVALSYFFWGVYLIFVGYIFYSKKTIYLTWVSVVNIMLNIGLNYILIPQFGAIGAAFATCIAFLFIALMVIIKSQQLYSMPWLTVLRK